MSLLGAKIQFFFMMESMTKGMNKLKESGQILKKVIKTSWGWRGGEGLTSTTIKFHRL